MALLVLSDMAEREAALGYTAPRSIAGSVTFSLPSLPDIGIARLDDSRDAGRDNAKSQWTKTVARDSTRSPKSQPKTYQQQETLTDNDESPSRSSTTSPSPAPPSGGPTTPQATFSTWLPDDSLRFVNPQFLSTDEKETLQSQLGKRKSVGNEDDIQSSFDIQGQSRWQPRRRRIGRPPDHTASVQEIPVPAILETEPTLLTSPSPSPSVSVSLPYHAALSAQTGPHHNHTSPTLARARPAPTRSSLGFRLSTTDLEILRSVKSNNLTLPPTTLYPPSYRPQYHSNPLSEVPPSYRTMLPRHPLPFTTAPLIHPTSTRKILAGSSHPHLGSHMVQGSQSRQTARYHNHFAPSRIVHPPPRPKPWFGNAGHQRGPHPSVLKPVSMPTPSSSVTPPGHSLASRSADVPRNQISAGSGLRAQTNEGDGCARGEIKGMADVG